jgi:hypothetical protein
MKRLSLLLPSKGATVNYSDMERAVFGIIPKDGVSVSTDQLTEMFYYDKETPFNARQRIISALRQLMRKIDHNKEPFRLLTSGRRGQQPMEVWIEKR